MKWLCRLVMVGVLASMAGCAGNQDGPSTPGVAKPQGTMALKVQAGYDDVVGFQFEVFSPTGELVAKKYVALEEENLPSNLRPDLGDQHRFADAFFTLDAGIYLARVTPMKSTTEPSDDCAPAEKLVTVTPSQTTEIVIVSRCDMPDNGGLDIIAVTNHDPVIQDLVYHPSKFVLTCQGLEISLTASDPDGDAIDIKFDVVEAPAGAVYEARANGNVLLFRAATAGTYQVKAIVCDRVEESICSTLQFPIHVSGDNRESCGCESMTRKTLWTEDLDFATGVGEGVFYRQGSIHLEDAPLCRTPYLVVPSSANNRVVVFDLQTLQPAFSSPYAVCTNPSRLGMDANNNIYVSCRGSSLVQKFSIQGQMLWQADLGGLGCTHARGVAYIPRIPESNSLVYVGCSSAGVVAILNAQTGALTGSITRVSPSYGLATDGERIYISGRLSSPNVVQAVDVATNQLLWSVPHHSVYGIVARNGKVWVATYGDNTRLACRYNGATGALEGCAHPPTGIGGRGIGIAPWDGTVWVADSMQNKLIKIDPTTFATLGEFQLNGVDTLGIAFDADRFVYAIHNGSNNITKLTENGQVVAQFGQGHLMSPYAYSSDLTGAINCQIHRKGSWVSQTVSIAPPQAEVANLSWDAVAPANSQVVVEYSVDGEDWIAAQNGVDFIPNGHAIQVRVQLASTSDEADPRVDEIRLGWKRPCECKLWDECAFGQTCVENICTPL